MKIDPNGPAFGHRDCNRCGVDHAPVAHTDPGLTVRAYMATQLLAGLLADPNFEHAKRLSAGIAVDYADALIAELNKETT